MLARISSAVLLQVKGLADASLVAIEADGVFPLASALVGPAPKLLFGQKRKLALDLVDPRAEGGREMDVKAGGAEAATV
jgi:hypothetical protein